MSLYDDLGLDPSATADEIKKAHRKGVKAHHPDNGGDPEKFGALQRSYEVLSDPERRQRYDQTGDTQGGNPEETKEREAMNVVISAFQSAIVGALSVDLVNIVAQAQTVISQSRDSFVGQQRQTKNDQGKIDRVLKRLKRKKKAGPDMVTDMLRAQRDSFNVRLTSLAHAIEVHDRASEIVMEYTYETDTSAFTTSGSDAMMQAIFKENFG